MHSNKANKIRTYLFVSFLKRPGGAEIFCNKRNLGFTILEMVVVLGIVTMISSMVLANYPAFNERLGVRRAAEDIASSIRQAQSYGLGVKEYKAGTGVFPGYGIFFQRYISAGVFNTTYTLFADLDNDLRYDAGEEIDIRLIQGDAHIYDICGNQKQPTPGPCANNYLYAEYLRPQPSVSLQTADGVSYSDVEVKIMGPRGSTKTIVIWLSGQVSIE